MGLWWPLIATIMENKSEKLNPSLITCKYCNCRILAQNVGFFIHNQMSLPIINQKKIADIKYEPVTDFYEINNMMMFENIGFSNTVDNCKYLVCADCERGPIGYHDIQTQKSFLAVERVKQQTTIHGT